MPTGEGTPDQPISVDLRVSALTIVKVCFAVALVWIALKLIPALILVVIALLLAVTLEAFVGRLERRGVSRGVAVAAVAVGMFVLIGLVVVLVVPPLVSQTVELASHLRQYRANVGARLRPDYPTLASLIDQVFALQSSPEVAKEVKRPLAWGQVAVEGTVAAILVFVLSLYFLIDGKRTYAWLLAYVPRRHRKKMALTMPAVSEVVMAYMQGQAITSALYGLFALGVLSAFRVPAALPLAVLAAVCDVIPILGIFLSTIPAVFFALTVSPVAAGAVLLLYLMYHALENYVIVPRVYGKRLRLSTLVVLIALLVGGSLYGIVGAVLILPVFAAYPIVEKIWLHEYLSDEVVADHKLLEKTAEVGSDRAVEAVLRGTEHEAEREYPAAATEARRAVGEEVSRR